MAEFYRKRKKICYMCAGKKIDYKDVDILRKYISSDLHFKLSNHFQMFW